MEPDHTWRAKIPQDAERRIIEAVGLKVSLKDDALESWRCDLEHCVFGLMGRPIDGRPDRAEVTKVMKLVDNLVTKIDDIEYVRSSFGVPELEESARAELIDYRHRLKCFLDKSRLGGRPRDVILVEWARQSVEVFERGFGRRAPGPQKDNPSRSERFLQAILAEVRRRFKEAPWTDASFGADQPDYSRFWPTNEQLTSALQNALTRGIPPKPPR